MQFKIHTHRARVCVFIYIGYTNMYTHIHLRAKGLVTNFMLIFPKTHSLKIPYKVQMLNVKMLFSTNVMRCQYYIPSLQTDKSLCITVELVSV